VVEASRAYERAAEPLLARAGIARGSAFRLDRMMQAHPLLPLLPWLALLSSGGELPKGHTLSGDGEGAT
jgi:hypothetical protein